MSMRVSPLALAVIGGLAMASVPGPAGAATSGYLRSPVAGAHGSDAVEKAVKVGHRHHRFHRRHHRFRHHRHFRRHHRHRHHFHFHWYYPYHYHHYRYWHRPHRHRRHFHHHYYGSNELGGALIGGALGAIVGSEIGHGKAGAVIGGAIIGAVIGSHIGRAMDEADRDHAAHVLETSRTGQPVEWRNPDTGNRYRMTPTRTYRNGAGLDCRDYTIQGRIGGREETLHGTACRDAQGNWRLDA